MKIKLLNWFFVPLLCLLFTVNVSAQITTLPYTQGFDDGALPSGWTEAYDPSCELADAGGIVHGGAGALRFYIASNFFNAAIVTPKIEVSGSNTIKVSFYYNYNGYGATLRTWYSTDAAFDPNSNNLLQFGSGLSSDQSYTWKLYEAELPVGTTYFEIQITGSEGAEIVIDDFSLTAASSCTKPASIAASNITTSSADVSWTAGTATAWDVYVSPTQVADLTSIVPTYDNITTASQSLTSLLEGTKYYVYVRSDCGGTDQSSWEEYSFTTACDVKTLPFSQNFNTAIFPPTCWQTLEGTIGGTLSTPYSPYYTWMRDADACTVFPSGAAVISFYNNNQWLITPSITLETGSIMTFDLALNGSDCDVVPGSISSNTTFKVMASTDGGVTWTAVETWGDAGSDNIFSDISAEGENVEVDLSSLGAQTVKLAFLQQTSGNQSLKLRIDNFFIEKGSTCTRPKDVALTAISANTATLSWTASTTAQTWKIAYSTTPIEDFTSATSVVASTNPYTLTGLQAQTTYYVYVQSNCTGGETSSYSQEFSFTTTCGAQAIPFIENFDSYTTGQNSFPANGCWNKFNSVEVSSYVSSSSANSLSLSYDYENGSAIAVLPKINAALNTLSVTFDAYGDPTAKIQLGIMSNVNDESSFVAYGLPVSTSAAETWENLEVLLGGYDGGDGNIALKFINSSSAYSIAIDNVVVQTMGVCPRPSNLVVSNISTNSATIAWTENGSATSWTVEYGETGYNHVGGTENTATINSINLTGLSADTKYDVYVKSACGSNWSQLVSFKTACGGVDVPFVDSLNNYTVGYGVGKFPENTCWLTLSSNGGDYPYITVDNGATCLVFSNDNSTDNYSLAVLPLMNAPIDTLMVEFETRGLNSGLIQVGVMSDPSDINTFVPVGNPVSNTSESTWNLHQVLLGSYTGSGNYIALKYTNPEVNYVSYYVENVKVLYMPFCPRPTSIQIDETTTTSAAISWDQNGDETSWNVCVSETPVDNFANVESVNVTTNPYTITGLNHSTLYYVYVQADCGDEDGDWSDEEFFETDCSVITVTDENSYSENFDVEKSGLPTCWVAESGNATDPDFKWHLDYGGYNDRCVWFDAYHGTDVVSNNLESPILDLSAMTSARLSFKFKNMSYYGTYSVCVSTDGGLTYPEENILATFEKTENVWQQAEYNISEFAGAGMSNIRIAFMAKSGASYYSTERMYLDELLLDTMPSCIMPSNLMIYNINNNSASVSWTEEGSATAWTVAYAENAITDFSAATKVNAVTSSCNIEGLTPSTVYYVYVQANCGTEDGSSEWVGPVQFTTGCAAFDLPFVESFDAVSSTRDCWTIYDANNDNSSWFWTDIYDQEWAYYNYATENGDDYLISPLLNITEGAKVTFDYRVDVVYNSSERFSVWAVRGIPTSVVDSAFILLSTQTVNNETVATIDSIALDNYNLVGQQIYIAIKCESYSGSSSLYVDNFVVNSSVSIEENQMANVNIYPNPANSYLNIEAEDMIESIEILTADGKIVDAFTANASNVRYITEKLANGIYFVKINTQNSVITKRFSVEK